MAQPARCLLHERRDLSSDPWNPYKAECSSPHLSPQYSAVRREAKRGEPPEAHRPASLEYAAAEKILPQTWWKVKTDPQGVNDFPYHHGTCLPPPHTHSHRVGEREGEGEKEEEQMNVQSLGSAPPCMCSLDNDDSRL